LTPINFRGDYTVIEFSWLRKAVADCYCLDNGRPSIDPEAALRLMLAGFIHGIVHDRKLLREAQVNLAIRWFAGYSLEDTLPDHSSLSKLRQRWGSERFLEFFERLFRILCQRKNTRSIRSQIECSIKPAFKEDGQLR